MNKILIIGANSATGRHFYDKIVKTDSNNYFFCDIVHAYDTNLYSKWHKINLNSFDAVYTVINSIAPNQIYNFAGTFSNDYDIDYKANVLLPKHIFDSIIQAKLNTRVLLLGSAAEYGKIDEFDNPVKEDHPLNPANIYGMTKAFQTNLMKCYFNKYNINAVMARPSNLFGKGFSNKLFIGSIYDQIEQFKKGKIPEIQVGSLEHKRDYISISDALKDYQLIMEYGKPGEIYNVSKGESIMIKDLLAMILADNNIPPEKVNSSISSTPKKNDIKDIFLNNGKIHALNLNK